MVYTCEALLFVTCVRFEWDGILHTVVFIVRKNPHIRTALAVKDMQNDVVISKAYKFTIFVLKLSCFAWFAIQTRNNSGFFFIKNLNHVIRNQ